MNKKKTKITVVWKITLWYTLFFAILSGVFAMISYIASDYFLDNNLKKELKEDVIEVLSEVEVDNGEIEVDEDIDLLKRGTYLAVYVDGVFVQGYIPTQFDEETEFSLNEVKVIEVGGTRWYMYDQETKVDEDIDVVVRGLVSINVVESLHLMFKWLVLILFPIILLIAIIGGYRLTRHSLQPVSEMRKTIEQISNGKDLTKRLNLGEGEDELYKLAHTFDLMFARLEESFEREKQFTSDVSHELRTPLSVILSQCEYAMELENEEETRQALESIYRQTKRMTKMVHQMLLLSRQEYEMNETNFVRIPVSEILAIMIEELEARATKKKICIRSNIEPEVFMLGDEHLILRFFRNLIENAIQYSEEDSLIEVILEKQGNQIQGYVKDHGIGIAPTEQEKIWNRLYRVNAARTGTEEVNSGLGLSMVAMIAKLHHGEVWVESELGIGSTFFFTFPLNEKKNQSSIP